MNRETDVDEEGVGGRVGIGLALHSVAPASLTPSAPTKTAQTCTHLVDENLVHLRPGEPHDEELHEQAERRGGHAARARGPRGDVVAVRVDLVYHLSKSISL